ncbi:MFS transporter [Solimonas soli]|uniref:MFS transporter n=1 Tax=Solimonas soli TaxID=413479 RepID=UPI000481D09F|nr:MFS transporter [Solimonas soli]
MSEALDNAATQRGGVPRFVVFSVGQGVSSIGTWAQKTAIGWLAWQLTHSPAWIGAVAMTDVIALLWVAPLSGAIVDRHNPYFVLQRTQWLLMTQAALLGACAFSGLLSIWALIAFALVESTLQGVGQPVRMTVTGMLGGRERLSQAIASSSIAFNLARSIGPAIAGLILAYGSAGFVFALNAVSYFGMILVSAHLRPLIDRAPTATRGPLLANALDGFRYVLRTPEMKTLFLLVAVFSLLMRPFGELLPAFAGAVFKGGAQTLSLLMTAQGIGALFGSLWMLRQRSPDQLFGTALVSTAALSVALILFCATPFVQAAVAFMLAAGAAHVISNIGLQSLVQFVASPEYRGRSLALYGLLFRAGPSLGAFVAGLAAHLVGLPLVIGAAAAFGGVLLALLAPAVRRGREPALPAVAE